jgi:hypothetical protein
VKNGVLLKKARFFPPGGTRRLYGTQDARLYQRSEFSAVA